MADSAIVVPDGAGSSKAIDNSAVTRGDATVVQRQRVNTADPDDPVAIQTVKGRSGSGEARVRAVGIEAKLDELIDIMSDVRDLLTEIKN